MQVGVEDLTGAQPLDLDRLRLLDLDDHVSAGEDLIGGVHELRTGGQVLCIGKRRTLACRLLDEYRVAVRHELARAAGRHADAELVVLDLLGHSNDHVHTPFRSSGSRPRGEPQALRACMEKGQTCISLRQAALGTRLLQTRSHLWSISYYDGREHERPGGPEGRSDDGVHADAGEQVLGLGHHVPDHRSGRRSRRHVPLHAGRRGKKVEAAKTELSGQITDANAKATALEARLASTEASACGAHRGERADDRRARNRQGRRRGGAIFEQRQHAYGALREIQPDSVNASDTITMTAKVTGSPDKVTMKDQGEVRKLRRDLRTEEGVDVRVDRDVEGERQGARQVAPTRTTPPPLTGDKTATMEGASPSTLTVK